MKRLFSPTRKPIINLLTAGLLALLLAGCGMFPFLDSRLGEWEDQRPNVTVYDPVISAAVEKTGFPVAVTIQPDSETRSVNFTVKATIPFATGPEHFETSWSATKFGPVVYSSGNERVRLRLEWSNGVLHGTGTYVCSESEERGFVDPGACEASLVFEAEQVRSHQNEKEEVVEEDGDLVEGL